MFTEKTKQMNIKGNNILLRAIEITDAELLKRLINDPDVENYILGHSFPVSEHEQIDWIKSLKPQKDTLRVVIETTEKKKAIGLVVLSNIDYKNATAGIHIKIDSDSGKGKGYGTDAINTMVNYAFDELRLHCIYANILSYNIASLNLFTKCGFQKEAILKKRIYKKGKFFDINVFSLFNEKYGK